MSYEDMREFQRREEMGADYTPTPLSFTAEDLAQHVYENPDDPDCEIPRMAMARDEQSIGLGEIDGGGA